jgi:nucleoside-diphosphate-sugar epimerase
LFPALGEPRMTRFVAVQLAKSHWFSHQRAHDDFGYSPIVDAETGMERLVTWITENNI